MAVNSIRPAAVAGSWYPGSPGALARDVDAYVSAVDPPDVIPRGDDLAPCLPRELVLEQAPDADPDAGVFKVPRVLGS